jgi:hypothetical protein
MEGRSAAAVLADADLDRLSDEDFDRWARSQLEADPRFRLVPDRSSCRWCDRPATHQIVLGVGGYELACHDHAVEQAFGQPVETKSILVWEWV